MTDLSTASRPETPHFTDRVRRKVVMQHKALCHFWKQAIDSLLIHFCTESRRGQALCFTPLEKRRAVGSRQYSYFADDSPDIRYAAAIEPLPFVKNHITHLHIFNIVKDV